jgi:hypothetical protein
MYVGLMTDGRQDGTEGTGGEIESLLISSVIEAKGIQLHPDSKISAVVSRR